MCAAEPCREGTPPGEIGRFRRVTLSSVASDMGPAILVVNYNISVAVFNCERVLVLPPSVSRSHGLRRAAGFCGDQSWTYMLRMTRYRPRGTQVIGLWAVCDLSLNPPASLSSI